MEVDNPQEPKDGGGTSEEDKSPDPMSPPAVQECKCQIKICQKARADPIPAFRRSGCGSDAGLYMFKKSETHWVPSRVAMDLENDQIHQMIPGTAIAQQSLRGIGHTSGICTKTLTFLCHYMCNN